jgi:Mn-containing catalase
MSESRAGATQRRGQPSPLSRQRTGSLATELAGKTLDGNKLKVWEMVEHRAARALTGYLLVRGGVHQVAYARAIERLTGADLMKLFPTPRIPTEKIPDRKPHIARGDHLRLYRLTDYLELSAVFNGPHPETGEDLVVVDEAPERLPAHDLPSQLAVFAPDYAPQEIGDCREVAPEGGLSKDPTGEVANGNGSARKRRTATKKTVAQK